MLINIFGIQIFSMQYTGDISPWRDADKMQKYQGQLKEDFLDIPLISTLTTSSYLQISSPFREPSSKIKKSSLLDAQLLRPTCSRSTVFKQPNSLSLPRFQLRPQLHHNLELGKSRILNNQLPNSNLYHKRQQQNYPKYFSSQHQKDLYESIKKKMQNFIKIREGSLNLPQNRIIRNKSQMLRSPMQPAPKREKNIVFQYSSISQLKKKNETSPRKKKDNHILDYLLEDLK